MGKNIVGFSVLSRHTAGLTYISTELLGLQISTKSFCIIRKFSTLTQKESLYILFIIYIVDSCYAINANVRDEKVCMFCEVH